MRKNDNFAHFQLAKNNLMDLGVQHLSNGLYNANHVVSLNLSMNKITSKGAEYLAEAIKYNQSLIELNLSSGCAAGSNRNRISEKGAAFIAKALEHNRFIQFLNVSGNCIGNVGAHRLLKSIAKANTVVVLKLNANDLTQHVAQSIHDFLQSCKSVKRLCLKDNKLGDAGVAKLATALEGRNAVVEHLNLSYCDLTKTGLFFLLQNVRQNLNLQSLTLNGNNFESAQPFFMIGSMLS